MVGKSVYAHATTVTKDPSTFEYHQVAILGTGLDYRRLFDGALARTANYPPVPGNLATGLTVDQYITKVKCPHLGHRITGTAMTTGNCWRNGVDPGGSKEVLVRIVLPK